VPSEQDEINRLRERVSQLEAELEEIADERCPPGSFAHFFKEPPRHVRPVEKELSADEYKEQVLKPLGYFFTEGV
jgi:hypothetical protein